VRTGRICAVCTHKGGIIQSASGRPCSLEEERGPLLCLIGPAVEQSRGAVVLGAIDKRRPIPKRMNQRETIGITCRHSADRTLVSNVYADHASIYFN
jgi:hypothetical protein